MFGFGEGRVSQAYFSAAARMVASERARRKILSSVLSDIKSSLN